jgi:hypothetical protein
MLVAVSGRAMQISRQPGSRSESPAASRQLAAAVTCIHCEDQWMGIPDSGPGSVTGAQWRWPYRTRSIRGRRRSDSRYQERRLHAVGASAQCGHKSGRSRIPARPDRALSSTVCRMQRSPIDGQRTVTMTLAEDGKDVSSSPSTSRSRGWGLGLYQVKRAVDRQCGEIFVDSVEGRGTTFTGRLPREPVSLEPVP